MKITQKPLDHFDERPADVRPSYIIIHYTDTRSAQEAEDYFFARIKHPGGGRVSCHYMIGRDGAVTQYVDESKRAWHAGKSYWNGVRDMNGHSIGIELENPGHTHGYRPFTAMQMDALKKLCADIMARHQIPAHRIIGHSDIAPERKTDPGEFFDWKLMAKTGIGVWPEPLTEEDYRVGDDYRRDRQGLRDAFTRVGYNPDDDLDKVITAFQRHFYPEAFRHPRTVGVPTRDMTARLHWLVRNAPSR